MPQLKVAAAANILAIAVGVKDYKNFPTLDAAQNNATDFLRALRYRGQDPPTDDQDTTNCIPAKNILDRTTGARNANALNIDIKSFLVSRANDPIDLIVFYYSGHGAWDLEDNNDNYYLTTTDTDEKDLQYTAIHAPQLCRTLTETGKPVVMIIDSCFSENAFRNVETHTGLYIVASSSYNKTAKYPVGEQYSDFTRAWIHAMEKGIPGKGAGLSFTDIYECVRDKMESSPQKPSYMEKDFGGSYFCAVNKFSFSQPASAFPVFDLDDTFTRLYNRLFDGAAFANEGAMAKKVLNSYPIVISTYLRELRYDYISNKGNPSNMSLLNSVSFLYSFYNQVIDFLSFLFIKDIKDGNKTLPEDRVLFNSWKSNMRMDFKNIQDQLVTMLKKRRVNILIIKKACSDYRDQLFIEEVKITDGFIGQIDVIEALCDDENGNVRDFIKFRKEVFRLIEELAFLQNYEMLAVRLVTAQKSFYDKTIYTHEVSRLYGENPTPYSYQYKEEEELVATTMFLNNSVIFIKRQSLPSHLQEAVQIKGFLNLWPFVIDGLSKKLNAQVPQIYMFEDYGGTENRRQFNYRMVQYQKERDEGSKEYETLSIFPGVDEWNKYLGES